MYFCFKYSVNYYSTLYPLNIGHKSVTMESNNSPPHKKSKKQIQEIIK
jgi:hypothetical protein